MAVVSKRDWIYNRTQDGKWQDLRWKLGIALNAILLVTPWVRIGGHPALLFDLPGRRLYVFGASFAASETFYLVLIGLFSAFAFFFFTSLFGRIWCGYACPQTVFLDFFVRKIEALIEGDWMARKKLDKAPWTAGKVAKKVAKWSAFLVVAFAVSMSLVSYLVDARVLWTGQGGGTAYGFVGAFTFLGYWNFAWFREQFCNFLCPYARFQGALTDDQSLVIAYDVKLGEPRRGVEEGNGSCIDCKRCVEVCPQGIDIRNGFQLECINCARCIDACTLVMAKKELPSLVSYTTIAKQEGRKSQFIRPRTVVYMTLMSVIALVFTITLAGRQPVVAYVQRAPGTMFQEDADGFIRNTYMLRVTNNRGNGGPVVYDVDVSGLEGAGELDLQVEVPATETRTVPLVVRVPKDKARGNHPFTVDIEAEDARVQVQATFLAPEGA